MNLDFGILWIEDSYSPEEEESLKRQVNSSGFIARIEVRPNSVGLEELAKEHSLYHCFDIILLDYRLRGENGDDLAPKIRKLFPTTTILFYSGSVSENELRSLIASKEVEGVYCSRRDQQRFIQRAGELIEQTTQALNRLSGMRGLAMKVVAECDDLMKMAMLSMCERDENCKSKIIELDQDVKKHFSDTIEKYDKAVEGGLNERFKTFSIDSAKIFSHFRRLTKEVAKNPAAFDLSEEQVDRLRELRSFTSQYTKDVLKKRNILGHVIETQAEKGWVLEGSDEISVHDFSDIRRTFSSHISFIREINSIVAPASV